jgi:hypothetical protein
MPLLKVRGADGSVEPGPLAPGSPREKWIEPAERAAAFVLGLTPQALCYRPLRRLKPERGIWSATNLRFGLLLSLLNAVSNI